MTIDNPEYWANHKIILKEELDKLDNISYLEISSDPYSPAALELERKVKDRLEKTPS
jgi:hypothetical protein